MQPMVGDLVEVQTIKDGRYLPVLGRVIELGQNYATVDVPDHGVFMWRIEHVEVVDR